MDLLATIHVKRVGTITNIAQFPNHNIAFPEELLTLTRDATLIEGNDFFFFSLSFRGKCFKLKQRKKN